MTNEQITDSGFLPEYLVLGMLKSGKYSSVSDDLITWGADLSRCDNFEKFCSLNNLSLKILQDAKINPPVFFTEQDRALIDELIESAKTSSFYTKLNSLIEQYGRQFQDEIAIPEIKKALSGSEDKAAAVGKIEKMIVDMFADMGLKCSVISKNTVQEGMKPLASLTPQNDHFTQQKGDNIFGNLKEELEEINGQLKRLDIEDMACNPNFIRIENHYFEKNFICKLSVSGESDIVVSYADKEISFKSSSPKSDILRIMKALDDGLG